MAATSVAVLYAAVTSGDITTMQEIARKID
jgi:hypothetical protein